MKKRLLASLLSLCLLVGLLPTAALAVDEEPGGDLSQVCTMDESCEAETHNEGCPLYAVPEPADGAEDIEEPEEPTPVVSPAAALQERINALPSEEELAEIDEHEQAKVYTEVCAIYDAIGELTDEEARALDMSVLEKAAAFFTRQIMPLDEGDNDTAMSGDCGATGSESSVTWTLTQNNQDSENPTYTLTISGTGAMADYGHSSNYAPWESYHKSITNVVIGSGITRIGDFACYRNAQSGDASGAGQYNDLKSLTFESGSVCEEIGTYAFFRSGLTSLTLPDSIKTVEAQAFGHCTSVTALNLGNGVETIGDSAFQNMRETTLVVPASVKNLGESVFQNHQTVTTITFNASVSEIPTQTFNGCKELTSITIANDYTSIGKSAFKDCLKLTSLSLSEKLVTIGESAFQNAGLTSISIPDSVVSIGKNAFRAKSLANVTLGSGLTEIGETAFYQSPIVSIRLRSNSIKIGPSAFQQGTDSTTATMVAFDMSQATSATFEGSSNFWGWTDRSILYVNNSTIKDSLTSSGDGGNYNYKTTAVAVTNGGTFADNTQFSSGTLATPIKEGAVFEGWYSSNDFSGTKLENNQIAQSNSTYPVYYAKWIDLTADKVSIQYDGTSSSFPTIEGVTLSNWQSSDPSIVSVEDGQLKANKVGKTTITATATTTAGGSGTLTVEVEVIPRVLTYSYESGDTGSGSVTYPTAATSPDVNTLLQFKWSENPQTEVTLTEGEDIDYTYTVPTENGGSGIEATVDFLPMTAGTYTVKFNLLDPNYTFAQANGGTTNTLTITANVTGENQTRAYISVLVTETEFTYDGTGKLPVSGILQAYANPNDTTQIVEIGTFTVMVEGLNDTTFHGVTANIPAGTDLAAYEKLELPTDPGAYVVTVSAANDDYYIYKSQVFSIGKATVTVKPNDKTAYVGDAVPALGENDYTVTGLASGDTLTTAPTLSYATNLDMSTAGTYTIQASGAAVSTDYYTLAYEPGTLTVRTRSSGGGGSSGGSSGNVSGSGDDVSITASSGTVTAAQMEQAVKQADSGETITIDASSRSSVSLPSSGLQDAADNNNDVTVELKNGDVTLSPEALSAVAKQAGTTVTLTVDAVSTDELNSRQQAAVGDAPVFDLTLKSGGKTITDFDGGLVTVAIPYELPDDQDPAGVVVWFMDDNGNITACETMYDLRTEMVIFTTRHFSKYVIGYVEPMDFTDVAEGAYYYDAVAWAVKNGVTNGISDNAFGPDVSCTRAQMVTFLWRAAGSPKPVTAVNPFTDVSASAYYYEAVLWAVENSITHGTSDNTFSPDATVTRGQTVTFIWRANGSPMSSGSSFADVPASAYYADAVAWAVAEGITNGTSATTFGPDDPCTRAQIVTFLYRDMEK